MEIGIWATKPEARRLLRTLVERAGERVAWEKDRIDNPFNSPFHCEAILVIPRSHVELVGSLRDFREKSTTNSSPIIVVGKEKIFPPLLGSLVSAGVAGSISSEATADVLRTCFTSVETGNYYFGSPILSTKIYEHIYSPHLIWFADSLQKLEIWEALAAGLRMKEVAYRLGLKQKTAENRKQELMRALDVHSQEELIEKAKNYSLTR